MEVNLQNTVLSKRSQAQKVTCYMVPRGHLLRGSKRSCVTWFHLYQVSRADKPIATECKLVVSMAEGWEVQGKCLTGKGHYLGVREMFWDRTEAKVVQRFSAIKLFT
jgi:hypothetical protein